MTDNLKSKSLCDPAKNYTMPFYSYFSERNLILKDLISQVLQCSLQEQGQTCFYNQNQRETGREVSSFQIQNNLKEARTYPCEKQIYSKPYLHSSRNTLELLCTNRSTSKSYHSGLKNCSFKVH